MGAIWSITSTWPPSLATRASSVPVGWTKRRTRSVSSSRRASSRAAIFSAVSVQRSADKLERLLSRRDRPRRPFLGDEVEQATDLRAGVDPELVASQQRLGG